MRLFLPVLLVSASLAGSALAQQASPSPALDSLNGAPIWRCMLPGGTYEVALRSIVSVSQHEYIVDGAARVTEVNVDTLGNLAVRFYYLEPITPQAPLGVGQSTLNKVEELAKEAADRTGASEAWQKVVKNYPTTTHAKTVEYRLQSRDQLQRLFASVERSFRRGESGTFESK